MGDCLLCPCLSLGRGRERGGWVELRLRRECDDQKPVVCLLQKLTQHHQVLLLAHHLGPLVSFLKNMQICTQLPQTNFPAQETAAFCLYTCFRVLRLYSSKNFSLGSPPSPSPPPSSDISYSLLLLTMQTTAESLAVDRPKSRAYTFLQEIQYIVVAEVLGYTPTDGVARFMNGECCHKKAICLLHPL